eukprot:15365711-Ditylum_brightwellii.AAC.1
MTALGLLPRRLMTVASPKCAACTIGAMTKRLWRTKAQPNTIHPVAAPGKVLSVDQLESSMQGFIAQLQGALTKQHYHSATIFTNNFSGYTYAHLQHNLTSKETVLGKQAFEAHLSTTYWCNTITLIMADLLIMPLSRQLQKRSKQSPTAE